MQKSKNPKELNTALPRTINVYQSAQTPIEIALQIDENGMTKLCFY